MGSMKVIYKCVRCSLVYVTTEDIIDMFVVSLIVKNIGYQHNDVVFTMHIQRLLRVV